MPETTYAPGDAMAVVTRRGVALVAAGLDPSLLTRIWEQLEDGRGLAAVLEALTGAFGTSLAAIPAFAVALDEGETLRVAVRGAMSILVETPAGTEIVSGSGVTTWSERIVDGVTLATLRMDAAASAPAALPIRDGVVQASEVTVVRGPAAPVSPAARSTTDAPVTAPVVEPAPSAGLIDSSAVLTMASADTLLPQDATLSTAPEIPEPPAPEEPPADEPLGATTGYDHLWGATVVRSVEDAAVRDEDDDENAAAAASPSPAEGDHDGATISVAQARALRAGIADAALDDSGLDDSALHHSGPAPLAPARAGALGRIRLSNGQVVVLDRTIVIGRRPRSTRVQGTDLPHLVAVESPQQDISRSHIEVRAEGDSILVTDLHTTNGSTLLRSGADPVRLHPGERTVVVIGDVIDLGDGISFTVEAAS